MRMLTGISARRRGAMLPIAYRSYATGVAVPVNLGQLPPPNPRLDLERGHVAGSASLLLAAVVSEQHAASCTQPDAKNDGPSIKPDHTGRWPCLPAFRTWRCFFKASNFGHELSPELFVLHLEKHVRLSGVSAPRRGHAATRKPHDQNTVTSRTTPSRRTAV